MTTFTPDELAGIEAALERAARIEKAAQKVIDCWDTCVDMTADIQELRRALEDETA